MNYPGSLDDGSSLPNPSASNNTNNPSHAGLHDDENAAIIAVETKLGTGSSTPASNTFLFGTGAGASSWTAITSAQLAAALSDETGSGAAVFANTPTLITPKVDTINENTVGNGVTVAGMNIKSGVIGSASTALGTNGVAASNLATSAIYLGYAQITSNFTTTTTPSRVDVTGLSVTVTVPSGSRNLKITAFCGNIKTSGSAGNGVDWAIMEGTTCLNCTSFAEPVTAYPVSVMTTAFVSAPSAGSHTYKVQAAQSGAGTLTVSAGSNPAVGNAGPAFILVELI